jgi:hypothetical protein
MQLHQSGQSYIALHFVPPNIADAGETRHFAAALPTAALAKKAIRSTAIHTLQQTVVFGKEYEWS